ncbi:MAG: GyrI-like domain-containing protein, partial [Hymenobacteraceae bacterium]|nr:GyrI-like domain-containing protein [Hymenobacteraceae bacterium]MDX5397880.1 GyrI-like domain-containing protein [Hymenobacteraceae bacterium]MDX5513951.1 GyrI-like domain-containing protein [Hymenobacteraceae bacterium]
TTASTAHVVGKYYVGSVKDESFGKLFQHAAELVEQNKLQGQLGGIYYNNPEEDNDTIKAFVGVVVASPDVTPPVGYELRTVEGGQKVLQAEVNAHYMLAPNKLYPAIFEYAEKNNLKLKTLYLERYPTSRHAIVQVPVL